MRSFGKILFWFAAAVLVLFVLMQLIPVDTTNPPVTREVQWDSPQTRALAQRACYDCHSNETVWPWYTRIAPVKFLLADHVKEGREKLNFSTWDQPQHELEDVVEVIQKGEMPMASYLPMHPEARLSAAEKQQLIDGLKATYAQDTPQIHEDRERGGGGDD